MKKLLLVSDIGGYTPTPKSLSEIAEVYTYIPRPSSISKKTLETLNRYCRGILKENSAFGTDGYNHRDWVTLSTVDPYDKSEDETVADIVRAAKMFGVDGIIFGGFESLVVSVARAAESLGLRGAGVEGAKKARNKLLMREAFAANNVPSPAFRAIRDESDILAAVEEIGYPLILKPTFLAASIGVTPLDGTRDPIEVYREVRDNILNGLPDQMLFEGDCLFLVESFMEGCNEEWYNNPYYGDYVSVEGLMVDGKCHPVAITDKAPINMPAFLEAAHTVPSILDAEAQAIILDAVIRANESLGLQNCPFHTEVKLMRDRQVGIIETAARFGGWNITPQVREVYGVDMSKAWGEILLHGHSDIVPQQVCTTAKKARCNLRVFLEYDKSVVKNKRYTYKGYQDLSDFLEGDVAIVGEAEIAKGSIVSLQPSQDSMSYVTTLDLEGSDPLSLARSFKNIREGIKLDLEEIVEESVLVSTTN